MADWTTLPNLAVGVGGLPSGTTVTALRDNPVAIAEGAEGAPRLYGKAAVPRPQQAELPVLSLSASDDVTLSDLHYSGNFSSTSTSSSTFQSAGIITSVLMSGTVRFRATQTAVSTGLQGSSGDIRILKNGTVIQTWSLSVGSNTNNAVQARSVDISVSVDDVFEWQVRLSSGSSMSISSIVERANDGYQRIGVPIKVSDL